MKKGRTGSGHIGPGSPWMASEVRPVPSQTLLAVAGANQAETYSCSAQAPCSGLSVAQAHRSAKTDPTSCGLQERRRSSACQARQEAGPAAHSHWMVRCCSTRRSNRRHSILLRIPHIHNLLLAAAAAVVADTCLARAVELGDCSKSTAVEAGPFLDLFVRRREPSQIFGAAAPYQAGRPCVMASSSSLPAGRIQALGIRRSLPGQEGVLVVGLGSLGAGRSSRARAVLAESPWRVSDRNHPRRDPESGGLCLVLVISLHQYPTSLTCQGSAAPRRDWSCAICLEMSGMGCRRILAALETSGTVRVAVSNGSLDRS